jgi:beta-lactam-binding protein with PASTA domain
MPKKEGVMTVGGWGYSGRCPDSFSRIFPQAAFPAEHSIRSRHQDPKCALLRQGGFSTGTPRVHLKKNRMGQAMANLGNFPRVRFVLILLFMHFLIFSMSCLPAWGQPLPTAKFPPKDPDAAQSQTGQKSSPPPVSTGKAIIPKVKVPPLTGLSPKQAAGKLESSGLKLGNVTPAPAQRQAGTIFRQNPQPPAEALPQTKVDVWVAQAQVPNLFGLKEVQAGKALSTAGLKLGTVQPRLSPRQPDTIVDQNPRPNEWRNAGSPVRIWIAQDGQVQVPELRQGSLTEAQQRLKPLKLQLLQAGSKPGSAAAGTIVEQDPQPMTWRPRGSQVKVWVSSGPEKVRVPALFGKNEAAARKALKDAKLEVDRVDEKVSPHPPGTVIDQAPKPRQEVEPGHRVSFTLALEKVRVRVPNLIDMSEEEAKKAVASADLKVGGVDKKFSTRPPGTVIDQYPKPRQEVEPGHRVSFTVALGPKPIPEGKDEQATTVKVPDLRGKGLQEAQNTLSAKELRLAKAGDSCSLSPAGTVVRQSPDPHSPARKGSAVQVWVAAGLFSPGCIGWPIGAGAVAALLIWLLYRLLNGGGPRPERGPPPSERPEPKPPRPPASEVRVAPDDRSKQAVVFEGQNLPALELRLRFTADPGTQDLETTGPLIKGERKEHE